MTSSNVLDMVILVAIFTLLQGVLWAWVGLQARKRFPWWPL